MLPHDDIIKWKHFPRYWPLVWWIHRSPMNSHVKCQWRGALMFNLICAWTNGEINNRDAGDLRRHRAHYDFTLMVFYPEYLVFDAKSVFQTLWHLIIWKTVLLWPYVLPWPPFDTIFIQIYLKILCRISKTVSYIFTIFGTLRNVHFIYEYFCEILQQICWVINIFAFGGYHFLRKWLIRKHTKSTPNIHIGIWNFFLHNQTKLVSKCICR